MRYAVKNWKKFQHFKDRRPPWIKLYRDLLDDREWFKLDPSAAKLLVMLWLIASDNEGLLPELDDMVFRLRTTETELESNLSKLSHWLEQVDITSDITCDINPISARYQDDAPEERREEERAAISPCPDKPKSQKATQLPDNFSVNEAGTAYAAARGVSIPAELEAFRNHHSAKGSTFKDWQAAWRSWCDKAVEFGRAKPSPQASSIFAGAK